VILVTETPFVRPVTPQRECLPPGNDRVALGGRSFHSLRDSVNHAPRTVLRTATIRAAGGHPPVEHEPRRVLKSGTLLRRRAALREGAGAADPSIADAVDFVGRLEPPYSVGSALCLESWLGRTSEQFWREAPSALASGALTVLSARPLGMRESPPSPARRSRDPRR